MEWILNMTKKIKFEKLISWVLVFMISIYPMIISLKLPERFYLSKLIAMFIVVFLMIIINLIYGKSIIEIQSFKKNKYIYMAVFTYMCFTAISTVFALDLQLAMLGNNQKFEGAFTIFLYVTLFIYAFQWYEYDDKHFELYILTSTFICTYGIFQKFHIDFLPILKYKTSEQIMYSTIGHPNSLGAFIGMSFFITLFASIKNNNIKSHMLTIIQFFALLCTQSMASWLGAFCGFVLLVYMIIEDKDITIIKNLIKTTLLLLIIAIIYEIIFHTLLTELGIFAGDVKKVLEQNNFSAGRYRMLVWKVSIMLILKSPLIGFGPECMNHAINIYIIDKINIQRKFLEVLNRAHNEYIHTMVSSGVFAGITQITLIFSAIYKGFNIKELNYRKVLTCSIVSYFVQANFSSSVVCVVPLFWIFLAVVLKADN